MRLKLYMLAAKNVKFASKYDIEVAYKKEIWFCQVSISISI